MKKMNVMICAAMVGALSASAAVFYEEDFEPVPGTNTVKFGDGKIRFGGNTQDQPSMNAGEYAVGIIADKTGVTVGDDGSGANNVLFVDGRYDKTYGGAVVIDPSSFGGTASVARLSFDLTEYIRKGGDGTACYVDVYAASGYDLSGSTDQKIVMDLKNVQNEPTTVIGVNGASVALLETLSFDHDTPLGNLDLTFSYDGTSAIVVVWESQYKSSFKIDNVQITDDGIIPQEGDPATVMFGGLTKVFSSGAATNNAFVSQIGAGELVQFNGVNSEGGSFGASGSLVNMGIGASLTNAANGLILTTIDIYSSNAVRTNTVSSAGQLGINASGGAANFQESDETAWSFSFNRFVALKQVVFSGINSVNDAMRITVDGVDYDLTRDDTDETDAWSGEANTEVYTFASPVVIAADSDVTIAAVGAGGSADNKWGLFGVVVDVSSVIDSLPLINFGGDANQKTNETYMAELGGDAIVAWWGGDDDGRYLGDVGNLKDQGVGATLSSLKYGVTLETLAISPAGSNTFVSGGSLGIKGGDNAKLDSGLGESWTLNFDKDTYLYKVGFKGFTGGLEVADLNVDGTVYSIVPTDCVAAVSESGLNVYTFANPPFVPAGASIQFSAPGGQWGIGNIVVGVTEEETTSGEFLADWLAGYPGLGAATNLTDNPDGDVLDNLAEYALGGNPDDAGDVGRKAVTSSVNVEGVDYFDYIYFARVDAEARGLSYEVVTDDDLTVAPGWTNVGHEVISGTVNGGFRSITNRFPSAGESKQFFQLNIELN